MKKTSRSIQPPRLDVPVDVMVDAGAGANDGLSRRVASWAEQCLTVLGKQDHELAVTITDDIRIQALNAEYRNKPEPTDVLSFGQMEGEPFASPIPVLGDLVISLETAQRQALELGHPLAAELRILVVHGVLHLIGHDHIDPVDRAAMAQAENDLLECLPSVPEWPTTSGLIARAGGP